MDTVTKFACQALQQGTAALSLAHKQLANQAADVFAPADRPAKMEVLPISEDALRQVNDRLQKLNATDIAEAERGLYPESLLFDRPWFDIAAAYPRIWLDMPGIWDRSSRKSYQEFAEGIDKDGYPGYYLQNFHYQTDGYLSDTSAELYDLQVEILFSGTADAMRRRILAPMKTGLDRFSDVEPVDIRVLDVAPGTGRPLRSLRGMLPKAKLFGLDLSPAYLRKANALLSELPGELPQLCQANMEELPYRDEYFHAVSCVFTFHELPGAARQNAIDSVYRVLKPGGTFTVCDSLQKGDVAVMDVMLENFPIVFHEPYHSNYARDDMEARLEAAGFEAIETYDYFASKYWVARKPEVAAEAE